MLDRVNVWVQAFKGRDALMLQWFDPDTGQRKSRSAKTADPDEAETKRADLEYELNHDVYREPNRRSWEEGRKLFEAEHLPGIRERSREKYGTVMDKFEKHCRPGRLRDVTERTLSAFVRGMREESMPGGKVGMAAQSIHNYLVALHTVLAWLVDQKLMDGPVPKFPKVKVPKKRPQPVPADDFLKVYAKAPDDQWRAYLFCAWWAGLRLSEARHLRRRPSEEWPWLDLRGDRIVLPAAFAKDVEDQWVPLHPRLREVLERLPDEGDAFFDFRSETTGLPLLRSSISHKVLNMAKRAGLKLGMHKLRKGFGCRAAKLYGKQGAAMLHQLMRHKSMQTTMDFYASVDDALQESIRELE